MSFTTSAQMPGGISPSGVTPTAIISFMPILRRCRDPAVSVYICPRGPYNPSGQGAAPEVAQPAGAHRRGAVMLVQGEVTRGGSGLPLRPP